MGVSQKSKRVTWASDVNLCQVKLFLSEDTPSQVRVGTQDHLQAKASHTGAGKGSDDNLPPGFEGLQPSNSWTAKLPQIPLIKWKRPLRFKINTDWQVVDCEESKEVETQNQREMRVLEAIYPRPSSIPPNPSPLANAEVPTNNDYKPTPVVPITPIEDEDAAATIDTSFGSVPANTIPNPPISHSAHGPFSSRGSGSKDAIPQPNGTISAAAIGVEPDIVAAAQAALTSVMSNSGGQGNNNNLIDHGLLIKILSDPKMIEHLITNRNNAPSTSCWSSTQGLAIGSSSMHNNSTSTSSSVQQHYMPNPRPPPQNNNPFNPINNITNNRRDPLSSLGAPPRPIPPPGPPFYPPRGINQMPEPVPAPGTKDANYYKSLIQQHGGERREIGGPPQFAGPHQAKMGMGQEHMSNPMMMMKPREPKPKIMKPCIYFNTSKGCRHGADCSYQHDVISPQQRVAGGSGGFPEVQNSKRSKLDL